MELTDQIEYVIQDVPWLVIAVLLSHAFMVILCSKNVILANYIVSVNCVLVWHKSMECTSGNDVDVSGNFQQWVLTRVELVAREYHVPHTSTLFD